MEHKDTDVALTETQQKSNSFVLSHPFPLSQVSLKLRPNSQAALATRSHSWSRLWAAPLPQKPRTHQSSLAWAMAGYLAGILSEERLQQAWPLRMPMGMCPQESVISPLSERQGLLHHALPLALSQSRTTEPLNSSLIRIKAKAMPCDFCKPQVSPLPYHDSPKH